MKLALEEVLTSDQEARRERGLEGAHDVAADAFTSPSQRRSHLSQQIDVTVRSILERGVVQLD